MLMKIEKCTSKIINFILGICLTLFSIGFSVMLVLNLTRIYKFAITKYDLVKNTGISSEDLMINYKGLINYLRNPFVRELNFKSFPMSIQGEIHFEEVKHIFMNLYIIMFISILIFVIFKSINKISKNIKLINILNYSSNMIILLFGIITSMIVIDFSKAFTIFHEIFFRNSYWIFDPKTDPIIDALPENLFMVFAIIIIVILTVEAILFKITYYKRRSNV